MKIKIALFFTIVFSILLITPTVISLVDKKQDVAFFLDVNEEEENQGNNSAKDVEIKIHPTTEQVGLLLLKGIQKKRNIRFKSKNYNSEYSKNTTPPPQKMS